MSDDQGGDPACWAHLFPIADAASDQAHQPEGTTTPAAPTVPTTNLTVSDSRGDCMTIDDSTLADLVHHLADAVIIAGTDGTITYWNAAAERLFGWSAADAVGQSLDLIIPDRQRRAHWDGYATVMTTGQTRYGTELLQVPSLHADGQRRSIAFTVTLLTGTNGAVTGIAAVVRDETARWTAERELRRQLDEARAAAGPAPSAGPATPDTSARSASEAGDGA